MALRSVIVILAIVTLAAGDLLRKPAQVTTTDVEVSLVSELAGNVSEYRLERLQDAIRPMYVALPKGPDGQLGHQAVRYVLHRLFVQRHSWYIRGLEPSDSVPPPYLGGDWVPAYLQGLLEQRLGERGINLHELAALAASLEDLVHGEATADLVTLAGVYGVTTTSSVDSAKASEIMSAWMMLYLHGGNYSMLATPAEIYQEKEWFTKNYADWFVVEAFLTKIQGHHMNMSTSNGEMVEFATMAGMVNEISESFGSLNDRECTDLKSSLLQIEDEKLGRVRLSEFYKAGLHTHWEFNEKIGYLRAIGALDESDPAVPRVILPNYLTSRSNCLEASNLYSVCCRNECEDLMSQLETAVASSEASLGRVADLVVALSSNTIDVPQNLSAPLLTRLSDIAQANNGQIPLHGRLFAQWMHHAFPRECPYPHESGTVRPQTPDMWMKETGDETHQLSEEEIHMHISNYSCSGIGPCAGLSSVVDAELPWNNVEELLTFERKSHKGSGAVLPSNAWFFLQMFVTFSLMLMAVGLIRRHLGFHYGWGIVGASTKHAAEPEADLRLGLLLCTVGAAANSAGLFHKAALGCALYGGFVLVTIPYAVNLSPVVKSTPSWCV